MATQSGVHPAGRVVARPARPPARGLPAPVAVGLALVLALFSGSIDALTGDGFRTLFAVFYIIGSIAAAALVRRTEIGIAVIAPPLVYTVTALAAAAFSKTGSTSWLSQELLELATSLVTHFPVLLGATVASAVVALLRVAARR